MIIEPAIDLKNRQCVRLQKGNFDTVHQVAADPVTTALAFRAPERSGFIWWIWMAPAAACASMRPSWLQWPGRVA